MDEFKVEILPAQSRGKTEFVSKDKAQAWAADLPLTDTAVLSSTIVKALQEINQSNLDIIKRFEVLEVLRSLTRTANEGLEKMYLRSVLPMPVRVRNSFHLGRSILDEMAKAYVILVEDVIQSGHPVALERLLPYGLYHAISYLARLMVSHYVVYAPEPKGVWQELHRLYGLAKVNKMEALRLKITRKQGDTRERSIDKAYKRVLLVSQATPYHLMQGEVNVIYNLMEQWSIECALLPVQGNETLQQVLVIDVNADAGPRYFLKDGSMPSPAQGWIFKCDGVRQIMNKKIREFLAPVTSADKVRPALGVRLERDMYFRLSDAWAVRRERIHERTTAQQSCDLVVGLSAYHYVSSGGVEFSPERTEIVLKKQSVSDGNLAMLELVDENDKSWKVEKEIAAVESGVERMRLSDFEKEQDAWENIHANQARHQAVMRDRQAEVAESEYQVRTCDQLDESKGGLKLFAKASTGIHLKVGEIIGLRTTRPGQKDFWRLASVRWVTSEGEDSLNFGVRFVSDEAKPMAARGLKGAGEGGEFIRVLIVPEVAQNKRELSLVTPAAVYDLESEVLVNNGKDLRTVRLTSLIETTNTFSRFRFEVIKTTVK